MLRSRLIVVGALLAVIAGVSGISSAYARTKSTPPVNAQAAGHSQNLINHTAVSKGYETSLEIQFKKHINAFTASRVKSMIEHAVQTSPSGGGPTGGAFLVCDKAHSFSDSDGTFTIQHACQGTTGPWGYKISAGLCAIAISAVREFGMSWTRNGKRQSRQSPHIEDCPHQFHGTFNPEDDFDLIAYYDTFTFEVEEGGQQGNAVLNIHGSFYSAECPNPSVCK